jgi:hypothetical protein
VHLQGKIQSLYELSATLDIYKEKVAKLEEQLKFQKDHLEDDFKKQSTETEQQHKKN